MIQPSTSLYAFISMPGGWEWIIIAIIGLLIFGKRLPEVGKSLGRSIVEFKKGLKGVEDEIERASRETPDMLPPPSPKSESTQTKTAEPVGTSHSSESV